MNTGKFSLESRVCDFRENWLSDSYT